MLLFGVLVFVFYLWHAFGVTIGLHRLLSHRAFRCSKLVEYFWVLGAVLAFHGSPIWWAAIHRAHHRYVETPLDPHSPTGGIWHAYAFYRHFEYPQHIDPALQCKDLMGDKVYKFLENKGRWRSGYALNVGICLGFRALLWLAFGPLVAVASLLAGILALNMPLILNIICHIRKFGYRLYEVKDDSVNCWFMTVFGLGDGLHNNHHANPGSSRMSVKSWELDVSWQMVRLMRLLGLAWAVNSTVVLPHAAIEPIKVRNEVNF